MRTNNRDDETRLERFLEGVFRRVEFTGHSDDDAFLAGIYRKLKQGLRVEPQTLGVWCWKIAPVTGIASFLLCLTFVFGQPGAIVAPAEGDEQVFTLLSENLEGDTIVEVILHEEGKE